MGEVEWSGLLRRRVTLQCIQECTTNGGVTPKSFSATQRYVFAAFIALLSIALSGASCSKKSAANPDEAKEARDLVQAIDEAEGTKTSRTAPATAKKPGPVNAEPLAGVDISKLDDKQKERFHRLIDRTLQSPCGKPHSLRKSVTSDQSCKRAMFAARYAAALIEDGATDADVQKFYEVHYESSEVRRFTVEGSPADGPSDAPVQLVEFYDYGCPACKEFAPVITETIADFQNQVVVFYKMYPLPAHPDSGPAAQAALAAAKQGKFSEMHKILFMRAHQHKKSDLLAHARSLGLDMAAFERDYAAAAAQVQADIAEGEAAKVPGTPTLFINGRRYAGPMHPRYLKLWIEEELAVNR